MSNSGLRAFVSERVCFPPTSTRLMTIKSSSGGVWVNQGSAVTSVTSG